jgi:cobalt-zinc-cadmium efflux system protein
MQQAVTSLTLIVAASVGRLVDTVTALLFVSGQHHYINLQAAFLLMVDDAGISPVVVPGGLLVLWQELPRVDPVLCLLVASFVIFISWDLLKNSLDYALDAAPCDVDVQNIRQYLADLDQVERLYDFHVWQLNTIEVALTVYLVVYQQPPDNTLLHQIQQHLHDHFEIEHATIQLETSPEESNCLLAPTTFHWSKNLFITTTNSWRIT